MATKKKTRRKQPRVCVTMDDGFSVDSWCSPRSAFLRDNAEDAHIVQSVRALRVGQSFVGGGGAAPRITVKRTR